jgi:ABC-type lipoprotein release transport system permease subunit
LRAMGITKGQGMRVFMYEQYSLILASLLLGSLVGCILACVVTAQFFLFLEYPFEFMIPEGLLWTMVVMSLVTTYFATSIPINEVHRKQVA